MTGHCNRQYVNKICIFSFCLQEDSITEDIHVWDLETEYFAIHENLFPLPGELKSTLFTFRNLIVVFFNSNVICTISWV